MGGFQLKLRAGLLEDGPAFLTPLSLNRCPFIPCCTLLIRLLPHTQASLFIKYLLINLTSSSVLNIFIMQLPKIIHKGEKISSWIQRFLSFNRMSIFIGGRLHLEGGPFTKEMECWVPTQHILPGFQNTFTMEII